MGNLKILKRLCVSYTILQTRFILVIQSVWNKIEDSNTVSGIEASKQVKSPSFLKWQCTPTHNGMLGKFKKYERYRMEELIGLVEDLDVALTCIPYQNNVNSSEECVL